MPSPHPEQITVRVSNKVLYIGTTTACPLAGVVRVQWTPFTIPRGRAIRSILLNLAVFLILFKVLGTLAGYFTAFAENAGLVLFGLLVVLIIRSWEPVTILWASRNRYHVLSISSSGGVGTQLANRDAESLRRVARMIIDAIDDPAADWQVQVVNHHVGDNIYQSGAASIAKVTA